MVVIKELAETEYSLHDVFSLIKEVYEHRAQEGIHFQALSKDFDSFEQRIINHNGIVFLAIDDEVDKLLGTGTILFHKDKKNVPYAGFVLAAVLPEAQGKGVGSLLREKREKCAREHQCVFISSSTAANAVSSIRYHLRTGAKKYSFGSSSESDYYSVFFRKYLVPSFWGSDFWCFIHYYWSKVVTMSLFKENGQYTRFGRVLFFWAKHSVS